MKFVRGKINEEKYNRISMSISVRIASDD